MLTHFHRRAEYVLAGLLVIAGMLVAAVLAPTGDGFLPNALFMWLPQAAVLLILVTAYRTHPAVIGGAAISLSIYLLLFHTWLFSRTDKDSMAWLGYLFSLPGAAAGALAMVAALLGKNERRPIRLALGACLGSTVGLAANQVLVCTTVMYCLGK